MSREHCLPRVFAAGNGPHLLSLVACSLLIRPLRHVPVKGKTAIYDRVQGEENYFLSTTE